MFTLRALLATAILALLVSAFATTSLLVSPGPVSAVAMAEFQPHGQHGDTGDSGAVTCPLHCMVAFEYISQVSGLKFRLFIPAPPTVAMYHAIKTPPLERPPQAPYT